MHVHAYTSQKIEIVMVVMARRCAVTDRILIRHADDWLALSREQYQEAAKHGHALMTSDPPEMSQNDAQPVWLRVAEVARLCSVGETFLYEQIRLERITSRRFGSGVRIHRDFVEHQTGDLMINGDNDD